MQYRMINQDKLNHLCRDCECQNYLEGHEVEFFKILDASLDVAVSILDENLVYQYISQSVYDELGFKHGEIGPGNSLSDCHKLMRENGLLNDEVLQKNNSFFNQKLQRQDSNPDSNFDIIELANGTVQKLVRKVLPNGYVVSMATNITDLVEKEKLLENSLILGHAGYWLYDFKKKSHKISQSIEKIVTKDVKPLIKNQGIIAFIHPEDRYKFKDALSNLNNANETFEFTARVLSQSPDTICEFTGAVVKNNSGEWLKLRTFIQDVTRKRKQAKELERARNEALAASRAKTQFVANMSHEIRTPMNGISGMVDLLAGTNIDDQQKEFINILRKSSAALLTIINDILDLSKIEAGALTIDPHPFNLRDCVNDIMILLSPRDEDKTVELIVNYPEGLDEDFIGDEGRIRQILTNLVGNALKFTKHGHVIIDVDIVTSHPPQTLVRVNVKDTGIGIKDSQIETIFKKFTQADGSTTRLYGGTGLGLSITRHLVKLMHGQIKVTSELGKGSTFSFELPLPRIKTHANKPLKKQAPILENVAIGTEDTQNSIEKISQSASDLNYIEKAFQDLEDATLGNSASDIIETINLRLNEAEMETSSLQTRPTVETTVTNRVPPPLIPPLDVMTTETLSDVQTPLDKVDLNTSILDSRVSETDELDIDSFDTSALMAEAEEILAKSFSFDALETQKPHMDNAQIDNVQIKNTQQIGDTQHLNDISQNVDTQPSHESGQTVNMQAENSVKDYVNVLVAEDFPLNQDVVRLMLADTKFHPTFANNGKEALETYCQSPGKFNLILMDVSMPVMDGYECTKRIQNYNREHDIDQIPIIALTGHALAHDRQLCIDAGMDDYMTKPVKKEPLMERLEHHYKKRSQSGFPIASLSIAS